MKLFNHAWNIKCHIKNDRSVEKLGMKYFPFKRTIVDMGISLIEHGFVEDLRK
jgi:hypothetical protein